ncbi:hypothetical protein GQ568_02505 [Patescibacteria group bacterium]|nr:hypothetical protein [Patescibacteria group bacterium]
MSTNKVIFLCSALFILTASSTLSYAFPQDNIYLYENKIAIKDSSVIFNINIYDPICQKGICKIGQQFSKNITFYKTKEKKVLKYGEWIEQTCNGPMTIECEINFEEYEGVYLRNLIENAEYKTEIKFPPTSSGGKRHFNVDIKTGELEEITEKVKEDKQKTTFLILLFIILFTLALLIIKIIKNYKKLK